MWAIVKNKQVVQLISNPRPVVINNIGHPKEIFIHWTKAEKKKIGVYDFISSSPIDTRFETGGAVTYTVNDSKGTVTETIKKKDKKLDDEKVVDEKGNKVLDEKGNQVVIEGLKSFHVQSIKKQAHASLAPSDWLIHRFIEDNTKKIPDVVKNYRKKVRDTSDSIITKIEATKALSDLKKLFNDETIDKDGKVTAPSTMNSMPISTIKEYER